MVASGISLPDPSSPSFTLSKKRPKLPLADIPTPEAVFKVPRLSVSVLIGSVLGPSIIALGVSIGAGEWILTPLLFGKYGFIGLGWVVLLAALFQTCLNVEFSRFTVATGEPPISAFLRCPPNPLFWAVVSMFLVFFTLIWGGWASSAGQSLFTLLASRVHEPGELWITRLLAIALLLVSGFLFFVRKEVASVLQFANGLMVAFVLFSLIILALIYVPSTVWIESLQGLVTPSLPPSGVDLSLLGSVAGYAGFAAGLNFLLVSYYRDKRYGMGARVGFLGSAIDGTHGTIGYMLKPDVENVMLFRRWMKLLQLDQWLVFFPGAILGIVLPSVLVVYITETVGAPPPTKSNMPIYLATEFAAAHGAALFPWINLISFCVLFSTQLTIFELLVRTSTEICFALGRLPEFFRAHPRRLYLCFTILMGVVISALIQLALPTELLQLSANVSTLAAVIFPLLAMYLNSKLPSGARGGIICYLVLPLSCLFYGIFFVAFVYQTITGQVLFSF